VSAEYQTPLSDKDCRIYGFGPAHPQHPRYSELYTPEGEPLDRAALEASVQGVVGSTAVDIVPAGTSEVVG